MGSRLLVILCALFLWPVVLDGREPQENLLQQAQQLRDRGQFDEAVKLLDRHLAEYPDDRQARRLRAQTIYWMKDFDGARQAYADALNRAPDDSALRLEYARMLAETDDRAGARRLLDSARDSVPADAAALTLLGTLAYWDGDLTNARKLFRSALDADPTQADALRHLREIDVMSAAWMRVSPAVWHDDQPLNRRGLLLEVGWFATPLLPVTIRAEGFRYQADQPGTFWTADIVVSHSAPSSRLETTIGGGLLRRPDETATIDWTGHGALALRAGGGVKLRGALQRAAYLHTISSLGAVIMTNAASGTVHWTHARGWLAEAAYRLERFPDENIVRSSYAWLLAPIARSSDAMLQAGYAVAEADADEDRFTLAKPIQPFPPSDPRFDLAGIYEPYYTPQSQFSHSAIAALTVGSRPRAVLRISGSYGFHAEEDATVFRVTGAQVTAALERRTFSPWTVRGSIDLAGSGSMALRVSAEAGRTAFYQWRSAGIQLTYTFLPRVDPRVP